MAKTGVTFIDRPGRPGTYKIEQEDATGVEKPVFEFVRFDCDGDSYDTGRVEFKFNGEAYKTAFYPFRNDWAIPSPCQPDPWKPSDIVWDDFPLLLNDAGKEKFTEMLNVRMKPCRKCGKKKVFLQKARQKATRRKATLKTNCAISGADCPHDIRFDTWGWDFDNQTQGWNFEEEKLNKIEEKINNWDEKVKTHCPGCPNNIDMLKAVQEPAASREVLETPEKRRAVALALADRANRANLSLAANPYKSKLHDADSNDRFAWKKAVRLDNDHRSIHDTTVRAISGQDGVYYPNVSLQNGDNRRLYFKNKEGELIDAGKGFKSALGKDDPRRGYTDHHSHNYYTADGKEYCGDGETFDDKDRPYRVGLTAWRGNKHVPLKVSSKYDSETGKALPDSADNIRKNGWATGRYRDKIWDKLAANRHNDYVYFLKNPDRKEQVDKEYQARHGRDDGIMKEISTLADSGDFGDMDNTFGQNMVKKAKLRNAKIKNIVNPEGGNGKKKRKRVLGKAAFSGKADLTGDGVHMNQKELADFRTEKEAERIAKYGNSADTSDDKQIAARQQAILKTKKEPEDAKKAAQAAEEAERQRRIDYNKDVAALISRNLSSKKREEEILKLRKKHGIGQTNYPVSDVQPRRVVKGYIGGDPNKEGKSLGFLTDTNAKKQKAGTEIIT